MMIETFKTFVHIYVLNIHEFLYIFFTLTWLSDYFGTRNDKYRILKMSATNIEGKSRSGRRLKMWGDVKSTRKRIDSKLSRII